MRNRLNILFFCALMMVGTGFVSCSEDDLGPSIFDTNDYPLDKAKYSFPLDTFLKVSFLEPFNVKFIYRMEDIGSDMSKNLTPADYSKSVQLAVLAKYLWYDVYEKHGTDRFLKENSPRIIHVIGSKNLNPSQGTEILGVAEGGLKISLYNVNNLNPGDIDMMNEYFFKTMHHEFGHILDQTHLRPSDFNMISRSFYDASTWTNLPDSMAAGRGFVSPYAASAAGEDWVEVLANYITNDSLTWDAMMRAAAFEWEEVDMTIDEYRKRAIGANLDTVGYYRQHDNGEEKVYRKVCKRYSDDYVSLDENGNVQWEHPAGVFGDQVILQKLEMVEKWLKEHWNINIHDLRYEVQHRQFATNPDGSFKIGFNGRLVNRLTEPYEGDPSMTLMDYLETWVTKFKSIQQ